MRIEIIDRSSSTFTCKYYVSELPESPFYLAWKDSDTKSVTYFDPKRPEEPELVLLPFSRTRKTIAQVIKEDMEKRGFPTPDEIEDLE